MKCDEDKSLSPHDKEQCRINTFIIIHQKKTNRLSDL